MMIRSTSNMALKPSGRGAYRRSRIVILASSETDHLSLGRHYGTAKVVCQDDSYSLIVWIRPMVGRMRRLLRLLLRQTRRSLMYQRYELPRDVVTVGVSVGHWGGASRREAGRYTRVASARP